jgi:hypothetical protein
LSRCATLLFGFAEALAYRLPALSQTLATLFQALPYVLRRSRMDRPLAPARIGRGPVRERVNGWRSHDLH